MAHTSATSGRRTSGTVRGSRPSPPAKLPYPFAPGVRGLGAGDGQEGMGQQGQGDVPVPVRPAADLVVIQADLGLGLLQAVLDSQRIPATRTRPTSEVAAGP